MERRQAFYLLSLFPAWLISSCNDKFPSAPTVVTGRVVDENGIPAEGIELTLSGVKKKGVSPIPTFEERTQTDSDGKYSLSRVVPSGTDFVEFNLPPMIENNPDIYIPYIGYDGRYEILSSPLTILSKEYGKTKTVSLQIRKL